MQRRELDLPKAAGPLSRRITERRSLEIQAYDPATLRGATGSRFLTERFVLALIHA